MKHEDATRRKSGQGFGGQEEDIGKMGSGLWLVASSYPRQSLGPPIQEARQLGFGEVIMVLGALRSQLQTTRQPWRKEMPAAGRISANLSARARSDISSVAFHCGTGPPDSGVGSGIKARNLRGNDLSLWSTQSNDSQTV